MARKEKFLKMVDEFLVERKKSGPGGGWAPVTQKEMEELYNLTYALLELKYETDADGDLPIAVRFVDRTMFRTVSYDPMFHDKAMEGYTEMDVAKLNLSRAVMNVGIAADEVRLAKIMLEEHLKKPK